MKTKAEIREAKRLKARYGASGSWAAATRHIQVNQGMAHSRVVKGKVSVK